jgi:hypothetical protein
VHFWLQISVMDTLSRLTHDSDSEVAMVYMLPSGSLVTFLISDVGRAQNDSIHYTLSVNFRFFDDSFFIA